MDIKGRSHKADAKSLWAALATSEGTLQGWLKKVGGEDNRGGGNNVCSNSTTERKCRLPSSLLPKPLQFCILTQ